MTKEKIARASGLVFVEDELSSEELAVKAVYLSCQELADAKAAKKQIFWRRAELFISKEKVDFEKAKGGQVVAK